jgi:hypothetical protein
MSEINEQQLIESINKKKIMVNKSAKGFGKVLDSKANDSGLSSTVRITDNAKPSENSETPESSEKEEVNQGDAEKPEVTVSLDNKAVTELINSLLEPLKKDLEESKKDKEAAEKALTEAKDASDKELAAIKKALAESQKDVETASKSANILEDLGKLMGKSISSDASQPLHVLGEGSQEMRNYEKHINQADSKLVESAFGYVAQKDLRSANQYWCKNRKQISEGVEAVLKNAGFLQGGNRILNAPTVVSDIPSVAFTHLSNFIRENTFDDLVHPQFFTRGVAPGTPPKLNTAIPNYPFNARPSTVASRQLTPGVDIYNGSNPVTERNILLTIEELGVGKDVNNQPLGLTSFVNAFSMADLESIITRNLGYDYNSYMDLRAYTEWFGASTILYPGQTGNIVTASGSLTANDGVLSRAFLINLNAFMKSNRFATFMGGYYGYMHNPGSWAQYAAQLTTQERFVDSAQTDLVSRMIQVENNGMGGVVSGFKGLHDGFMHFMTNSYGVGAAGSTGATSITVATVPTTYDSNFAFGSETIAEATALPVEIRSNEVNDYGRRSSWIWYSHQGFASMNVNANATTGTERRVVQVRNRRTIG